MDIPLEREIKLSATPEYALPDLRDLSGEEVRDSGVELLETVYWDTRSIDVARRGYGLRHRRHQDRPGDAGVWTLKTPGRAEGDRVVRGELEVAGGPEAPPVGLLALLPPEVDRSALHPIAVLHARRRVLTLSRGPRSSVEVMDDSVEILERGGLLAERFRELEVEVHGDADELADQVAARLRAAGAGPPESGSKYRRALRALGYPADALAEP